MRRNLIEYAVVLGLFVVGLTTEACSEEIQILDPSNPKKRDWRWRLELSSEQRYDSNVFRLSDATIRRFEEARPGDVISGRFRDMEELDDFVVDAKASVTAETDGLWDRDFTVKLGLGFEYFIQNPKKSSPRVDLDLVQSLGKGRELALEFRYEFERFSRNYLFEATDLTGNVSSSERVYRSGGFDQGRVLAKYSHRIWRRSKKRENILRSLGFRELEGEFQLGYVNRSYDDFSNRDRHEVRAGTSLASWIGKNWRVDTGYRFRFIDTPGGNEVLILDEPDFGVDFNGDLDTIDENRRTVQRVDRSRMDHSLAVEVRWDFRKRWEARLGYQFLYQEYFSDEPFDLSYNNRSDTRHKVFGGVEWHFAKRWAARVGAAWMDERSDRLDAGDEGEETSYNRYTVFVSLSTRF